MKKVRVEMGIMMQIDVDEQDEDKAMTTAEAIAMQNLYDNYHSNCILDHLDDGIVMVSCGVVATDCEEVNYDD